MAVSGCVGGSRKSGCLPVSGPMPTVGALGSLDWGMWRGEPEPDELVHWVSFGLASGIGGFRSAGLGNSPLPTGQMPLTDGLLLGTPQVRLDVTDGDLKEG